MVGISNNRDYCMSGGICFFKEKQKEQSGKFKFMMRFYSILVVNLYIVCYNKL